jgi:hypothetical protein
MYCEVGDPNCCGTEGQCAPRDEVCFGAWRDEAGACRAANDGVLPASCCDDIEEPPTTCPDPDAPGVHYIAGSEDDPSVCAVIDFACDEGETPFSDLSCGCGCLADTI